MLEAHDNDTLLVKKGDTNNPIRDQDLIQRGDDFEAFSEELASKMEDINGIAKHFFPHTGRDYSTDDLAQDIAMRALQYWFTFRLGTNMNQWFYRIGYSIVANRMKRVKRYRQTVISQESATGGLISEVRSAIHMRTGVHPHAPLMNSQYSIDACETLSEDISHDFDTIIAFLEEKISDKYLEAMIAVDVADMTHEEYAESVDMPKGTSLSRSYRARRAAMKACLANPEIMEIVKDMGFKLEGW